MEAVDFLEVLNSNQALQGFQLRREFRHERERSQNRKVCNRKSVKLPLQPPLDIIILREAKLCTRVMLKEPIRLGVVQQLTVEPKEEVYYALPTNIKAIQNRVLLAQHLSKSVTCLQVVVLVLVRDKEEELWRPESQAAQPLATTQAMCATLRSLQRKRVNRLAMEV